MREVKRLEPAGPRKELLEYFAEYAEDYNTMTLPSERYYDVDKHDASLRAAVQARRTSGLAEGTFSVMQDVGTRRLETARKEAERLALIRASLQPERVAAMARQAALQGAMQYAHKAGDMREVARLKARLEPEDPRDKLGPAR